MRRFPGAETRPGGQQAECRRKAARPHLGMLTSRLPLQNGEYNSKDVRYNSLPVKASVRLFSRVMNLLMWLGAAVGWFALVTAQHDEQAVLQTTAAWQQPAQPHKVAIIGLLLIHLLVQSVLTRSQVPALEGHPQPTTSPSSPLRSAFLSTSPSSSGTAPSVAVQRPWTPTEIRACLWSWELVSSSK